MRRGSRFNVVVAMAVASSFLISAAGTVRAADEWFVLGEQTIKAVDQGVDIKSEGSRWKKDVKQVKFSVEGADVDVTKMILKWDNRPDQTLTDIGTIKAGGQSVPKDAPGRKARLTGIVVQYKIAGSAPTAVLKVWGYD